MGEVSAYNPSRQSHHPVTGMGWRSSLQTVQGAVLPLPPAMAVSNSGSCSRPPFPCGNQSSLERSAPMHPPLQELLMWDCKSSVWVCSPCGGRALMLVTLMGLLQLSKARPETQLCLPVPTPWDTGYSHAGGLHTGTVTGVMGVFLRAGCSHSAIGPGQRSCFLVLRHLGLMFRD